MTVIIFLKNGELIAAKWNTVFIDKDGLKCRDAGQLGPSLFNYAMDELKKVIIDGVTVFECE